MSNIDGFASEWLEVKAEEKLIIARRHAIEAQITEALEAKSEGSITHKLDLFKVTLTQPVSRKVDPIVWEKVKDKLPIGWEPVKHTISADPAACRYLVEKEPRLWAKVSKAFETKQGKVGVKVEAL